jgi:LytS/YehU family sensor histidine kinase
MGLWTANRERGRLFGDWGLALKSILGFWVFYAVTVVARALLGTDPLTTLQNKLINLAVGVVLTGLIYVAIATLGRGGRIRRKAIVAALASTLAAVAMASVLFLAEDRMAESKEEHRIQAREGFTVIQSGHVVRIERTAAEPLVLTLPKLAELDTKKKLRVAADATVVWLFFFMAWSAFYLAIKAQAQVLDAQRRAVEAESAAKSAQVRALRYQVNPHFLFNTLNSLSSLIMARRADEAEEMILKLSKFFRSSLSLDPTADVTLTEEIALQSLYLDIERVRFPTRLMVRMEVPSHLGNAKVPALILQPLVENAVKFGVSASRDTVTLVVSAREAGPGRFIIEVTNSGQGDTPARKVRKPDGTGVGIANVCDRLRARFGEAATCEFGATENGGYRVALTLPLDRDNG